MVSQLGRAIKRLQPCHPTAACCETGQTVAAALPGSGGWRCMPPVCAGSGCCLLCCLVRGIPPDCLLQVNQPKWGTQTVKLSWVLESCRQRQHLPEQGFQVALPPVRVSCV